MRGKRPALVVVKKDLVRELSKDPYWREKLDRARSTAEAIRIIREFGRVRGYSTDDRSSNRRLMDRCLLTRLLRFKTQ